MSSIKKGYKKNKIITRPCSACGHEFDETKKQCPACRVWQFDNYNPSDDETIILGNVTEKPIELLQTGEWDRCFGKNTYKDGRIEYGIPTKSVILLGGYPGAGKSTLSLMLASILAGIRKREVLYIGTEEAKEQIKGRAERLGIANQDLVRLYPLGAKYDLGTIMVARKPGAIVFDSLSGFTNDLAAMVDVCKSLKKHSTELDSPVLVIDHVTKEGDFSGLMALQHTVDATLTLLPTYEGRRELGVIKNRFGPDTETVEFIMTEKGLIPLESDDSEEDETEEDDSDE